MIEDKEEPCCGQEGDKEEKEVGNENIQFMGDLEEIFSKIDFAKEAERDESIRVVLKAFKDDLEGKSEDIQKALSNFSGRHTCARQVGQNLSPDR